MGGGGSESCGSRPTADVRTPDQLHVDGTPHTHTQASESSNNTQVEQQQQTAKRICTMKQQEEKKQQEENAVHIASRQIPCLDYFLGHCESTTGTSDPNICPRHPTHSHCLTSIPASQFLSHPIPTHKWEDHCPNEQYATYLIGLQEKPTFLYADHPMQTETSEVEPGNEVGNGSGNGAGAGAGADSRCYLALICLPTSPDYYHAICEWKDPHVEVTHPASAPYHYIDLAMDEEDEDGDRERERWKRRDNKLEIGFVWACLD